jgi:hypothetical protein
VSRSAAACLAPVLLAVAAAGCRPQATEIVLVVESELAVPQEMDTVAIIVTGAVGPVETDYVFVDGSQPVTVGLLPLQDGTKPFTVEVQGKLFGIVVVSARATSLRFVEGKRLMLELVLRRACTCQGTTCPSSSTPGCEDLVDPNLPPLDEKSIPPLSTVDGGPLRPRQDGSGTDRGSFDGGETRRDAPDDRSADRSPDGAPADARPDGAADAQAEAGPMCTAAFGGCSPDCAPGTYCSANGMCVPGFQSGGFCQVGGCTCAAGLTCQPPESGTGAGQCL